VADVKDRLPGDAAHVQLRLGVGALEQRLDVPLAQGVESGPDNLHVLSRD
jgi:hypothetical protein